MALFDSFTGGGGFQGSSSAQAGGANESGGVSLGNGFFDDGVPWLQLGLFAGAAYAAYIIAKRVK